MTLDPNGAPNHAVGCTGYPFTYSGNGYNRVKVCRCGAEDHAPESNGDLAKLIDLARDLRLSERIIESDGTVTDHWGREVKS